VGIWNYLTSDYVWDIVAREGIFLPGTRIRAWSWSSSPTHRFPTCFILNMINHYSILYIICTLLYVYDIYIYIYTYISTCSISIVCPKILLHTPLFTLHPSRRILSSDLRCELFGACCGTPIYLSCLAKGRLVDKSGEVTFDARRCGWKIWRFHGDFWNLDTWI